MDDTNTEDATPVPVGMDTEDVEAVKEEPASIATRTKSDTVPAEPTQSTTTCPATLQSLADKALDFLSHASNETLGACLVGVGAATYLVLGRVGLLIIGVAGGVVLHATWDGTRSEDRNDATKRSEQERRREAGVEVMRRVLESRSRSEHMEEKAETPKVYANQRLDFSDFQPETAEALSTFTNTVIKDYVYYWYGPQLPGEESFPASCRRTFIAFMLSLSRHLHRKRPADAFLDFVTNASSIIIVFLNELAAATNASPNTAPAEAVQAYLEMKPDTSLAYILDEKSQNAKLESIAEDIIQAYLDPKVYSCEPVHVFLNQVLAQLVLGSTVTLCSRPEWINEWIVYGLEESETTKEVMNIVDAGVEGRTPEESSAKDAVQISEQARVQLQEVASKKEGVADSTRPKLEHKRQSSRAEEAMDEAMREAKRLTQLMIEEDEKRAREGQEKYARTGSSEDVSEVTTQGAPTPTSSQSDHDRQEEEADSWITQTQTSSAPETPVSSKGRSGNLSAQQQFTSFDQLVPPALPTALSDGSGAVTRPPPAPLTLHKATISIFDDSVPGEKASMQAKPTIDYLVQIEPSSSAYSGWMISRKYADFETLHEVLRRISVITGVSGFAQTHNDLPKWKLHSKASLRAELERYLTDAVKYQPLAESEGMKRFLEKDQGLNKSPSSKGGFAWPTPDGFGKIGGDMMNVLTKAPKQVAGSGKSVFDGVAGGGKAVFGGVAGLVGGVAGGVSKRQHQNDFGRLSTSTSIETNSSRPSLAMDRETGNQEGRQSHDSLHAAALPRPRAGRHISTGSTVSLDVKARSGDTPERSSFEIPGSDSSSAVMATSSPTMPSSQPRPSLSSPSRGDADRQTVHLPPPPSEMPEDYGLPMRSTAASRNSAETSRSTNTLDQRLAENTEQADPAPPMPPRPKDNQMKADEKPKEPLSESETAVAVELMFAVVTELFTLSSAWNIRRTLLTAAKTYLLRPGNPQLVTIRDLLQSSLLDANLSDSGMASHIYKLRENALRTEEEMEIWRRDYPEKTAEQKEELRLKARKLLVSKGMPVALQSVMGAAASGEALGKVFDCLQVSEVARGLVFGLMLQALRVVTH
ncbi:hypothetical protein LTR37_018245 [Vermiconidia calcicola]|uniref:Uncharacterized protein n=1 Tax=Vermiconidia calcicola TaxID=1690605 RepID=A0ACC3MHM3_9PEZI|nr:hypothetical protein LTR37_018245 [Vermiconidia calcicola]